MYLDVSIVLAKFWGLFYLIFSALFLITGQLNRTIDFARDNKFVIATGYSTLIMGLITVSTHNLWVLDWRVTITLLGWVAILKSVHKIGFPESIARTSIAYKKKQIVSALVMLGLSLFLLIHGFGLS